MSDENVMWTDIKSANWINLHLSPKLRPYAYLMRLDRPIGTWLLLWPCWWAIALASKTVPSPWLMILFGIGAITMRGAGCVINDIFDHNLDKKVERTHTRPLASGEVKIWQAILFLCALLIMGLGVLLLFNRATIIAGILSLFLVFSYPLMKRITWWPQLFLGLTFNWGALLGWLSVNGHLEIPSVLLYIAGITWTLGYDTIYAYQDIKDDALVGIKSTARLFDKNGLFWVGSFYAATIVILTLTGWFGNEGKSFYVAMIGLAGFSLAQLLIWDMNNAASCLHRFQSNRNFGLIVFAAIVLGKWF